MQTYCIFRRKMSVRPSERALQSARVSSRSRGLSMDDTMVRRESAIEYFKELVDGALARQGIAAGELTAFYVVQLLTGFLQRRSPTMPSRWP